ncbi:hypothetical protein [Streptomyces sp. CB02115]|uniref:hypothetical protein n=1 Tax=Streptomyces sp. CB02115 TaxID=1703939 RepID=UPI003FD60EE5
MARPTTTSEEPAHAPRGEDRLRQAWRAAHEPAAGVPRWARRVACTVPLVVLPSGIWRLGVLFTEDKRGGAIEDWAMNGYIVFLTLLSEILAFTAVGLVARWGEVVPRWMPWLRGRRVPTAAAVVPATIGATILTLVFTVIATVTTVTQSKTNGDPLPADFPSKAGGWETVYFYAAYVPLVLWGPMLGILTYAYWRRRGSATTGRLLRRQSATPRDPFPITSPRDVLRGDRPCDVLGQRRTPPQNHLGVR